MHEDYEEDDDYNDDYYDYDNGNKDLNKHFFKFDTNFWQWFGDALNDITWLGDNVWMTNIPSFKPKSIPVSSWISNTGAGKSLPQYLGTNYQNQPIWKTKYFVNDPIAIQYINHIKTHAVHFVKQPHYYKGMFDILN